MEDYVLRDTYLKWYTLHFVKVWDTISKITLKCELDLTIFVQIFSDPENLEHLEKKSIISK